ncbi:MAG: hypothetical protein LBH01_11675 [Verrucomicrobiales bacterium]|jgi:Tfp pilus assembly protein PilV|nr:hypothetical protein [Verrucomicrobiales bacterium]
MTARSSAPTGRHGFSLIEVVLALSILTYALVAILMLFPLALNTASDSKSDTRATFIAQSLLAEIQSRADTGNRNNREILSQVTSEQANTALVTSSRSTQFNLADTNDANPLYIVFDNNGTPLRTLNGAADYNNGTSVATAFYISRLSAAYNPDNNPATAYNYSRVTLTVEWPAAAKPVDRKKQVFVTLIVPEL